MILPPPLPPTKRTDHASVWQLVLGVIGVCLALLSALAILALILLSKKSASAGSVNLKQITFLLWVLGLMVVLAIPSIVYAIRRLSGSYSRPLIVGNKELLAAAIAAFLWCGLVYLGSSASAWNLPDALTSPLNILVIAVPILVLLAVGLYRLNIGGKQRAWGLINVSIFVTTQIILVVEMLMIVAVFILGGIWLSKQAQFAPYLALFKSQSTMNVQSVQTLVGELTPLLSKPIFYAAIALVFCLFIPLIEECFKPLGVWFLAGKKLTPAQGFAAGLICGAAFGLFESLSMISIVSGSSWVATAIARIGTGLLHTFTAGVSGWALASTWQDKKYYRISLVYIGAVLLHGCWNLFAVLMGVRKLSFPINSDFLTHLMDASSWVLGGITILMLAGLILMNFSIRKQQANLPVISEISQDPNNPIG